MLEARVKPWCIVSLDRADEDLGAVGQRDRLPARFARRCLEPRVGGQPQRLPRALRNLARILDVVLEGIQLIAQSRVLAFGLVVVVARRFLGGKGSAWGGADRVEATIPASTCSVLCQRETGRGARTCAVLLAS